MRRAARNRASIVCVLGAVLLTHAALLASAARWNSPTFDEIAHLPAGISHWKLGRFELYRVNPPLVRMVAALPVLAMDAQADWGSFRGSPGTRSEFDVGRDFMTGNNRRSFWLFTVARWACIPFSLVGAYVCYQWARELFGLSAGLVCVLLWCFSPNILAYGPVITPDLGATSLGLAAAYLFWRWLKAPGWSAAVLAGVVLGLAELTKLTWLVLFPLWPARWVVVRLAARERQPWSAWRGQTAQLAAVLLLGLYVLNASYGFDGTFTQLSEYRFISQTLRGDDARAEPHLLGNRFAGTWLGAVPVPLPKDYVAGIDEQKEDFEKGRHSYLRGEIRGGGWWYYYLYALAVKVPLGAWALILLASILMVCRTGQYAAHWRDELVLLAPLVVVLVFVSSETGFGHHLRYVLPIFPYAMIWMSRMARSIDLRHWGIASLGGAALSGRWPAACRSIRTASHILTSWPAARAAGTTTCCTATSTGARTCCTLRPGTRTIPRLGLSIWAIMATRTRESPALISNCRLKARLKAAAAKARWTTPTGHSQAGMRSACRRCGECPASSPTLTAA